MKKTEFSKKLAIYVLTVYAIFAFAIVGVQVLFKSDLQVVDILSATIGIPMTVLGFYYTKAGVENYQKINKNPENIEG
jgi:Na+/phosphate symporter